MATTNSGLHTNRLDLLPLTLAQLDTALLAIPQLAKDLDRQIVSSLVDDNAGIAVRMKISKMGSMPAEDHPWQTYWLLVLKVENIGIGLVGFKGKPDAGGEVEIGYGIDPGYQGKGYMTEAVAALVDWAFSHAECTTVTAQGVKPDNFASQKVLVKNGFTETDRNESGINFILQRTGYFSSL
jgi:[ribosomal protein S5]-alanine N-acetyltransferase